MVYNIIKPCTKNSQCKFIDLFLGLSVGSLLNGSVDCVDEANVFHSYAWGQEPATTFGTFLQRAEGTEDFFWWDIFCQNQVGHRAY